MRASTAQSWFGLHAGSSGCLQSDSCQSTGQGAFPGEASILLSKLDRGAEAAQLALSQFEEVPEQQHHRVTLAFLGRQSVLRDDVMAVAAGCPLSERLQAEVKWLQDIALGDSVGETPHAVATRLELHARGAKFGYHSATQRCEQNLGEVEALVPTLPVTLQWLWDEYMRVGNMKTGRKLQMPRRALEKRVYHLQGMRSLDAGEDDNSEDCGVDSDVGRDPGPGPGLAASSRKSEPKGTTLFRQWLESVLQPSMVVSVDVGGGEGLLLFQILELPRRIVTVDAYDAEKGSHALWNVHKFDLWRGSGVEGEPDVLEAFSVESPLRVDIMGWIGHDFARREKCRQWEPALSDVEGCQKYHNPQRLRVQVQLSSSTVPILALIDELEAKGYDPVSRRVDRRPAGLKRFDNRSPSRLYLQAAIASEWLWSQGCMSFLSGKTAVYYSLLLKDPSAPIHELTTDQLRDLLKGVETVKRDIAELDVVPAARAAPLAPLEDEAVDGDDGGGGGACDLPHVSEDEGQPDDDDDEPAEGIDGDAGHALAWPTHVMGAMLHDEDRVTPSGQFAAGFRIICPVHGMPCRKFRSKHLRVEQDGRWAPVYFLGAWVQGASTRSQSEHGTWTPSVADIRNFMLSPDCP